jgi:hypothetical protein|tara:strand:+ start:369 stop:581 length:213 start_codon:yes stop_codon:yes gene_type:complete
MPSKNPIIKKALKSGKISQKQYERLPEALLLGIAKKGDKKGGVKEKRKKTGKEKGKVGRPKAGSKVKVVE